MFTCLLSLFLSLSLNQTAYTPETLAALIRAVNEDVLIVVVMQHSMSVFTYDS